MAYTRIMVNQRVDELRNWRVARGLSKAAAGALLGVTRQCWHDWEWGRRIPGAALMIELYSLTDGGVTPNDFYDLPTLETQRVAA